jgi:ankyrin repeat protein
MNSLHYAIDTQEENFDIVERLVEHGININLKTTEEGYSPLIIAVKRGHINIVKYSLKIGAIIYDSDNFGNTPLHLACELGEKDIV